jgi:hypothetical protein
MRRRLKCGVIADTRLIQRRKRGRIGERERAEKREQSALLLPYGYETF